MDAAWCRGICAPYLLTPSVCVFVLKMTSLDGNLMFFLFIYTLLPSKQHNKVPKSIDFYPCGLIKSSNGRVVDVMVNLFSVSE